MVLIKIQCFWDMKPCQWADNYRRFEEAWSVHFYCRQNGRKIRLIFANWHGRRSEKIWNFRSFLSFSLIRISFYLLTVGVEGYCHSCITPSDRNTHTHTIGRNTLDGGSAHESSGFNSIKSAMWELIEKLIVTSINWPRNSVFLRKTSQGEPFSRDNNIQTTYWDFNSY